MLNAVFERFVAASPVSVMSRGLMEGVLAPDALDRLKEANAQVQYTRELLFSDLVNLMSLVVCGIYPSVNAAYRSRAQQLNVSRTAVYDKLNGVEPRVSAALLKETAATMASIIEFIGGAAPKLLAPYKVRIIDGNCLAGTDHRLEVLRPLGAVALPGKSLVILDPELRLAIDVFPCVDGHAQERSLFDKVLAKVQPGELWIGDRSMCTSGFLRGITNSGSHFVKSRHKSLSLAPVSERQYCGETPTGQLFEQMVRLNYPGGELLIRQVTIELFKPTRNGEKEVEVLTRLFPREATAAVVAQLYLERRSVENLFQTVTENYEGEIQTLGYPQAALFSFCLGLVTYNVLATIRAVIALGSWSRQN